MQTRNAIDRTLACLALSMTLGSAFAYEFASGVAVIPEGTASRSKLVWAADGVATNGIVSYYRHTFDLPAKPAKATLDAYLDDSGTVYVNGSEAKPGSDVAPLLASGRNTIAVRLENKFAASAAMYLVACENADGGRSYVHSDGSAKGTVAPQAQGWEMPDFDDSAWPRAKVCGDVLAKPWSLYHDLRRRFATPEEYARLKDAEESARSLPDGLAGEPEPVARVVYRGSRPMIEINGRLHDAAVNICEGGDPYRDSAIVRCAQAGFGIVEVKAVAESCGREEEGPFDFTRVDESVRRILHLSPDSYLVLGIRFGRMQWAKRHPGEQVGYATGPADPGNSDDYRGRPVRPSAASELFREASSEFLRECAAYVKSRPWAKRVVGVRLLNGVYGEWHPYGMFEAPDTGARMQERFRAYMKAKRGVEDASVPTAEMRRHAGCDLLDPAEDRLALDYYDCHANVSADLLLSLAGEARHLFPGRLVGAYYGYLFTGDTPEGSNALLEKVLSSPDIDFLSNPPFYSAYSRLSGGSYAPRTITSAFRRHGKLSLLEDDSRFHHVYGWLDQGGRRHATKTPRETEMNMRRNWLNQFFDGDGIQLYDPMKGVGQRPHAFDDPAVFKAIADSRAALAEAGEPAEKSGNAVAVVMSARERLRQDGGSCTSFTHTLYERTFLDLYRSGAAFDMLTLEDYLAGPRDYRTVLFLNAFYLTEAERGILTSRMREPGMTSVWIGPAGGVTDSGFDDAAMSALTGVSATGAARRPRIVCRDPQAAAVCGGKAFSKALAGGARSIVVPEPPQSPEECAALLAEAGAWMYVAPGSYFRRHGDVFMFHTGTPGVHEIRLPEGDVKVRELFSGTEWTAPRLALRTDGPGTWLFKVGNKALKK